MVFIDIPELQTKDTFIGDGSTIEYTLSNINPIDIHVMISGIYLTELQDYIVSANKVIFNEVPLLNENINIVYKY